MLTNEQLKKIQEFAIDLDWNQAFGGASKGNRHLFRIVAKAKLLAQNKPVDVTIVEAGAWLHDTNLEKTVTGDTLANKEKIVKFLTAINVSSDDVRKILHCIEAHDGRIPATTIEGQIVHDADTLEKMGPLGVIRETWKRAQIPWTSDEIIKHLPSHLKKRESKLYTAEARKIATELNKELNLFFKTLEKQVEE